VDAAVLMSHRFEEDADALERFAAAPPRYLGLLGSRERADGLFEELKRRRGSVPAGLLQSLHAPAGLDIGAQGPEEIALAIVSEVRAVLAGRTGGFLRDRRGPIHERENGNGFDCDRGLERVLDDPDVRRTAVHARVDDPLPVR
jgi:xanthine/CO dehydrogenase XdhC/CoxF family maturation factor